MPLLQDIQTELKLAGLSFTLHANKQMIARHVKVSEVREALLSVEAEVIEDYPGDSRGPSCLVFGIASGRALHIHVSHPPGIVIITVYEPNSAKWETDLKKRR